MFRSAQEQLITYTCFLTAFIDGILSDVLYIYRHYWNMCHVRVCIIVAHSGSELLSLQLKCVKLRGT